MVRTTSTIEPWQMAYIALANDVNGSAILRSGISERFDEESNFSKEKITNALRKLHFKHGMSPKEAIKTSSSITNLLNKPQTLDNE